MSRGVNSICLSVCRYGITIVVIVNKSVVVRVRNMHYLIGLRSLRDIIHDVRTKLSAYDVHAYVFNIDTRGWK